MLGTMRTHLVVLGLTLFGASLSAVQAADSTPTTLYAFVNNVNLGVSVISICSITVYDDPISATLPRRDHRQGLRDGMG